MAEVEKIKAAEDSNVRREAKVTVDLEVLCELRINMTSI